MRSRGGRRLAPWLALALLAWAAGVGSSCTRTYTRADLDRERDHAGEENPPPCGVGDSEVGCEYQNPACLDDPDLCGPPAR